MHVAEYNRASAESADETDTRCECVIHQRLKWYRVTDLAIV